MLQVHHLLRAVHLLLVRQQHQLHQLRRLGHWNLGIQMVRLVQLHQGFLGHQQGLMLQWRQLLHSNQGIQGYQQSLMPQ